LETARERLREGFALLLRPVVKSREACWRVLRDVRPFFGGGNLTPARRAFDNPMAIAC
jgi:hypothetical protein